MGVGKWLGRHEAESRAAAEALAGSRASLTQAKARRAEARAVSEELRKLVYKENHIGPTFRAALFPGREQT